MLSKLGSRKLWATVAGAAVIAFGKGLGLDDTQTLSIAGLVAAYIAGQSHVDATMAKNGK